MTFSEFAEVLNCYLNENETQGQFVIKLVNKIMGGRPGRAHGKESYQNPLCEKSDRTLQAYYNKNDKRKIPKSSASIILSSIDKYKFDDYIRNRCSEGAQNNLLNDLSAIEDIDITKDAAEVCADLFEKILHDLASK